MVKLYLANTDNEWFDLLAQNPHIDEVNFWQPSAKNFNAISVGEIIAFRLKSPRAKIGGFGILSSSSILPIQIAWDAFGEKNGRRSAEALVNAIAANRPDKVTQSTFIGCRILVQPVFLPEFLWFDLPSSWANNIVGGKVYSTDEPDGRSLWDNLQERAAAWTPMAAGQGSFSEAPAARYGEPTLILPRLGQGAFRVAVMETYKRQCAITDGKVLPALDAAHIRPFADGGLHRTSNGILLRKDIHSVFDSGYATIDVSGSALKFVVSNKVKEIFDNGNEYRRLHGATVRVPDRVMDQPVREALRWHNSNRFLG